MLPRWVTTGKPRAPAGDSWPPSSRAPTPGNNGAGGVLFDDVVVSSSPVGPRSSSTPVEGVGWGTMKAMFR